MLHACQLRGEILTHHDKTLAGLAMIDTKWCKYRQASTDVTMPTETPNLLSYPTQETLPYSYIHYLLIAMN